MHFAARDIPTLGGVIRAGEELPADVEGWPNFAALLQSGFIRIDHGERYIVARDGLYGGKLLKQGAVLRNARELPNLGNLIAAGYVRVATAAEKPKEHSKEPSQRRAG